MLLMKRHPLGFPLCESGERGLLHSFEATGREYLEGQNINKSIRSHVFDVRRELK